MKHSIKSIGYRSILNSHVQFTTEYILELDSGKFGTGSAPVGETISIYEREKIAMTPQRIIERIRRDGKIGIPLSQAEFDHYLQGLSGVFGRLHSYAISLAFFSAAHDVNPSEEKGRPAAATTGFPRICLNILNGGRHAYTNAVLSDFTEFLLVSRNGDPDEIIRDHDEMQRRVKEKLILCDKVVVGGNLVSRTGMAENRVWLDLLSEIRQSLHLSERYDLMIDASAGDLWNDGKYAFSLTDGKSRTTSQLCDYWLDLIRTYQLKFLEDPFREQDFEGWRELVRSQSSCDVIGDNLYSSHPLRIKEGAKSGYSTGVIIKPDQAGSVTATIDAIATAQEQKQLVITSHRSISTESVFLSTVTSMLHVQYVKIGPLVTDYSSVLRFNELLRCIGAEHGPA